MQLVSFAPQQLSILEEFRRNADTRKRVQIELATERKEADQLQDLRRDRRQREVLEEYEAAVRSIESERTAFHDKLDRYDAITVEALMDNRRLLDQVIAGLEDVRSRAYVLPDGRKVFKTNDGQQVFDERGKELGHDIIDPDAIPDSSPKWQEFKSKLDLKNDLDRERDDLLKFQASLDKGRDDSGRVVSKNDIDAIGAELEQTMPDVVKRKLAERGVGASPAIVTSADDLAKTIDSAPAPRRASTSEASFGIR